MLLVSCGTDVKLHESPSYELVNIYRPANSTGYIRNVSWCKDGSWLAIVPNNGNAEIIRTKEDVRLLQSVLGVAQPTTAVFQRTTKKNIAISTVNGGILLYDIKSRSIKKTFPNSGMAITMLDWSLKDTHLAAGCSDGQVSLYSNTTNQRTSVLNIPSSKSVSVVRFHRTQRAMLGAASDEGVIVVWDINVGRHKFSMKAHKAPVTDLVFSSQNHHLLTSVGLDRTFQCYDTNAGHVALTVLTDHPLSAVDMAPDGHTVAVASSRGTIYIYDLREHHKPMKTIAAHTGEIRRVSYQPQTVDTTESINITEDRPIEVKTDTRVNASADSFSQMLNNINEFSPRTDRLDEDDMKLKSGSAGGDSFFAELGNLDGGKNVSASSFTRDKSELSNLGISIGVKKWLDSKSNQSQVDGGSSEPSTHELEQEKGADTHPQLNVRPTASTPRQNMDRISVLQNQNCLHISPILGPAQPITQEDITKIVKNVVSEQMSDFSDILNRHLLNMNLGHCQNFLVLEQYLEKILSLQQGAQNTELVLQNQQLQEENEFLKTKINELLRKNH